ncbi:hypothetical protein AAFP35_11815 [Gordonia sp. CPCC 206044]|uniref:hypothetical protein n=1 Tax=Gordonia sp. CPCC 206044 TaxID=3140793 RepID=UPI003AF3E6FB
MRIELASECPADQPDPLGRAYCGWRDGLSPAEAWDRGRGVWAARAADVMGNSLLLITFAGEVKMVGTIDSVTRYNGRVAVTGCPLPNHPLIGQPDPLADYDSDEPIVFGTVVDRGS